MAEPILKQISHAQKPKEPGRLGRSLRSRAFAGGLMVLGVAAYASARVSLSERCVKWERADRLAVCTETKSPTHPVEIGSLVIGISLLFSGLVRTLRKPAGSP